MNTIVDKELLWFEVEFNLGGGWKIISPQIHAIDQTDAIVQATVRLAKQHPQFQDYTFARATARRTEA